MNKELANKIHDAVDYAELNPLILKGIKDGLRKHPGNRYGGTYWENYHIIKRLNLGHRPTKEETDECSFYAVAKLLGKGDAQKGIQNFLGQFEGKPLEE
jgi:hypothetical protein